MAFNPEPLVPSPTTPKEKGDHGEKLVASAIAATRTVSDGSVVLLNDLRLPIPDSGKVTQIDHIVACPSAVLVIETKNWAGFIFGTAEAKVWTQTFPGGGKQTLSNPVAQCESQANIVDRHLGNKVPVVPIVVMVGDGELKKDAGKNITTLQPLIDYVTAAGDQPVRFDVRKVAEHLSATSVSPTSKTAKPKSKPKAKKRKAVSKPSKTADVDGLLDDLKQWRKRVADSEQKQLHHVFSNKTLMQVANQRPATLAALLDIHGIGEVKADRYGDDILAIIAAASAPSVQPPPPPSIPSPPPSASPTLPGPTIPPPLPSALPPAQSAGAKEVAGEAAKLAKKMIRNWGK